MIISWKYRIRLQDAYKIKLYKEKQEKKLNFQGRLLFKIFFVLSFWNAEIFRTSQPYPSDLNIGFRIHPRPQPRVIRPLQYSGSQYCYLFTPTGSVLLNIILKQINDKTKIQSASNEISANFFKRCQINHFSIWTSLKPKSPCFCGTRYRKTSVKNNFTDLIRWCHYVRYGLGPIFETFRRFIYSSTGAEVAVW